MTAVAVHAQSAALAQAGKLTPAEQLMVDAQLGTPKLDPRAVVTAVYFAASPLRDSVAAIARSGGITVRYHSGVTNLDEVSAVKLVDSTVEDALRTVLNPRGLAFKATGSKAVFVYPDTPENREKYTESMRTFAIAKADIGALSVILNRSIAPLGADELRPTIVSLRDSKVIAARATPDMMAKIARLIADNDK